MPRYKYIDTNPKFLAIDRARQLLPGTFEHALHHLLEHALDLTRFDARFRNDETGAPAYPPKVLLQVVRLQDDAAEWRTWLAGHPDERRGPKGTVRQSNRTDADSATMATSKRVIQGYTGMAAVDDRAQIIVVAQAHGTGSEHDLLVPVVDALTPVRAPHSLLTADAGYQSEANCRAREARGIDALLADNQMRRRDARCATQHRHQQAPHPLHNKSRSTTTDTMFHPRDFTDDPDARTGVSGGQGVVSQGRRARRERVCVGAISRDGARLRIVRAPRAVSAHARHDARAERRVHSGARGRETRDGVSAHARAD